MWCCPRQAYCSSVKLHSKHEVGCCYVNLKNSCWSANDHQFTYCRCSCWFLDSSLTVLQLSKHHEPGNLTNINLSSERVELILGLSFCLVGNLQVYIACFFMCVSMSIFCLGFMPPAMLTPQSLLFGYKHSSVLNYNIS